MRAILNTPVEQTLARWWAGIDDAHRKGFFAAVCVSILAFGFEMTNLTLHHDDVIQIFIQDTILGSYLGRFGVGWLHYYTQNAYFMPFLQMIEGIVLMSAYGVLVAHFWGLRRAMDIALVSAILGVFPYMAQVYQYNTSMASYPMAHLLAASAVVLASNGAVVRVGLAAVIFAGAFSIYQAVAANALTIFVIWLLSRVLFADETYATLLRKTMRPAVAVGVAAAAGGVIYLVSVSLMDIRFDSYQSAQKAFSLGSGVNLAYAVPEIVRGTRGFFSWPESYFPNYLKGLQLILVAGATICCLWLPRGAWAKITAVTILGLACFAPRVLQLLHAEGRYHNLTLTGYALVIAGAVMIVNRTGTTLVRNASVVLTFALVAGYVMQCNWISTVNHLNTVAHFHTVTQILARIRSLPDAQWDGRTIAVVGSYNMPSTYPFKAATGVATEFIDAAHMDKIARLLREEVVFVQADGVLPQILESAERRPPWPHPESVNVVGGVGMVVLSKNPATLQ